MSEKETLLNLNNWWAVYQLPIESDSTPIAIFPDEIHADAYIESNRRRQLNLNLPIREYEALKLEHRT